MDFTDTLAILAALERHGVRYVLVGSLALAAHGLVRAMRSIELFVSSTADNVERLKAALREVFADESLDEISAAELAGDYPAIQYVPPHGRFALDILARLGEAFAFDDLEAETVVVDGVPVHVATPLTLYRMKRDTVRPQDRLDAEALRRRFDLGDEPCR